MEKISIIMPTYNSEKYVGRALKSVIEQTYPMIELIIIDGDSKDRTMDIINNHREHISIVVSEPDDGIYDAFNKGILCATGDIIYFLNSDDYLIHSIIIEEMMACFDKQHSIVYGDISLIYENDQESRTYGREFSLDDLSKGYVPPHQAFFVRKQLFEIYGLFDKKYKIAGDFERAICFFKNEVGKIKYINKNVAAFRVGGISSNYVTRAVGLLEKEKIIKESLHIDRPLAEVEIQNNALYRQWLEMILVEKVGITRRLHQLTCKNVAVFGSLETADYLIQDLSLEGFVTGFIIDNFNSSPFYKFNIPIIKEADIDQHLEHIDCVIVSIESAIGYDITARLKARYGHKIAIFWWKEFFNNGKIA
ncbi:glycosyltransferase family 2 protein [Paenibacillus oryzisoli]|uniref:Glycosyltransferase 2-like domain-containing protein n=1 Tax=Paenibacillus oryzisoli TaxID=1850517 RepID=A0A197ZZ75_9BACL|nr:glycosyltransferase family 2 protein [Paenibacillus oryzisoli]OAS14509.1 hypothetical protein A8708_33970 [Paenibacillus oryzisoli]